eukprot:TRINITY_DN1756_c0_g1_i1.p1 TRINITY_DN1756_c0_g1~~TRINITY_DN1756_c0_g1_i1.p1  ORF type:complete len:1697 (+),score=497.91 TRINITY_DN1756_c0_g1_i1:131-5092(+)
MNNSSLEMMSPDVQSSIECDIESTHLSKLRDSVASAAPSSTPSSFTSPFTSLATDFKSLMIEYSSQPLFVYLVELYNHSHQLETYLLVICHNCIVILESSPSSLTQLFLSNNTMSVNFNTSTQAQLQSLNELMVVDHFHIFHLSRIVSEGFSDFLLEFSRELVISGESTKKNEILERIIVQYSKLFPGVAEGYSLDVSHSTRNRLKQLPLSSEKSVSMSSMCTTDDYNVVFHSLHDIYVPKGKKPTHKEQQSQQQHNVHHHHHRYTKFLWFLDYCQSHQVQSVNIDDIKLIGESSNHLKAFILSLVFLPTFTELIIHGCYEFEELFPSIAILILRSKFIEKIVFKDIQLTKDQLITLGEALTKNIQIPLKSLCFDNATLDDKGLYHFGKSLSTKLIRCLTFNNNTFQTSCKKGVGSVLESLMKDGTVSENDASSSSSSKRGSPVSQFTLTNSVLSQHNSIVLHNFIHDKICMNSLTTLNLSFIKVASQRDWYTMVLKCFVDNQYKNLKSIDVSSFPLSDNECFKTFKEIIELSNNIKYINVSHTQISGNNLVSLLSCIDSNPTLNRNITSSSSSLSLSSSSDDFKIEEYMSNHVSSKIYGVFVKSTNNGLTVSDAKLLQQIFQGEYPKSNNDSATTITTTTSLYRNVKGVDLSNNEFSDLGMVHLLEGLANCSPTCGVEIFICNHNFKNVNSTSKNNNSNNSNSSSRTHLRNVLKSLTSKRKNSSQNHQLKVLHIAGGPPTSSTSPTLPYNNKNVQLTPNYQCSLHRDLIPFLIGLSQPNNYSSIEELNISGHRIGDEGIKYLASVATTNTKLKVLFWDLNNLTIKGLKYFANSIEKNPSNIVSSNNVTSTPSCYLTYAPIPLQDIHHLLLNAGSDLSIIQEINNVVMKLQNCINESLLKRNSDLNRRVMMYSGKGFIREKNRSSFLKASNSTEEKHAAITSIEEKDTHKASTTTTTASKEHTKRVSLDPSIVLHHDSQSSTTSSSSLSSSSTGSQLKVRRVPDPQVAVVNKSTSLTPKSKLAPSTSLKAVSSPFKMAGSKFFKSKSQEFMSPMKNPLNITTTTNTTTTTIFETMAQNNAMESKLKRKRSIERRKSISISTTSTTIYPSLNQTSTMINIDNTNTTNITKIEDITATQSQVGMKAIDKINNNNNSGSSQTPTTTQDKILREEESIPKVESTSEDDNTTTSDYSNKSNDASSSSLSDNVDDNNQDQIVDIEETMNDTDNVDVDVVDLTETQNTETNLKMIKTVNGILKIPLLPTIQSIPSLPPFTPNKKHMEVEVEVEVDVEEGQPTMKNQIDMDKTRENQRDDDHEEDDNVNGSDPCHQSKQLEQGGSGDDGDDNLSSDSSSSSLSSSNILNFAYLSPITLPKQKVNTPLKFKLETKSSIPSLLPLSSSSSLLSDDSDIKTIGSYDRLDDGNNTTTTTSDCCQEVHDVPVNNEIISRTPINREEVKEDSNSDDDEDEEDDEEEEQSDSSTDDDDGDVVVTNGIIDYLDSNKKASNRIDANVDQVNEIRLRSVPPLTKQKQQKQIFTQTNQQHKQHQQQPKVKRIIKSSHQPSTKSSLKESKKTVTVSISKENNANRSLTTSSRPTKNTKIKVTNEEQQHLRKRKRPVSTRYYRDDLEETIAFRPDLKQSQQLTIQKKKKDTIIN